MHGIDVDKEQAKRIKETTFKFGDPSSYKHLSDKDKEALTEKMLGMHKGSLRSELGKKGIKDGG